MSPFISPRCPSQILSRSPSFLPTSSSPTAPPRPVSLPVCLPRFPSASVFLRFSSRLSFFLAVPVATSLSFFLSILMLCRISLFVSLFPCLSSFLLHSSTLLSFSLSVSLSHSHSLLPSLCLFLLLSLFLPDSLSLSLSLLTFFLRIFVVSVYSPVPVPDTPCLSLSDSYLVSLSLYLLFTGSLPVTLHLAHKRKYTAPFLISLIHYLALFFTLPPLLLPAFAQVGYQLYGMTVIGAWSFFMSLAILAVLRLFMPLRVPGTPLPVSLSPIPPALPLCSAGSARSNGAVL